ncbi:hypothetical protein [Candidatus Chlorohelix sp.]|uniref:hypothetical protein n=1 Tax=Candidatus Chlorohelix sp. TaxID=3139201 RepID=UPI00306CA8C9
MFCIYCGFKNKTEATDCANCGKPLLTTNASSGTLEILARLLEEQNQTHISLPPSIFDENYNSPSSNPDNLWAIPKPPFPEMASIPESKNSQEVPTPPTLQSLKLPRQPVNMDSLTSSTVASFGITEPRPGSVLYEGNFTCPNCRQIKPLATSVTIKGFMGSSKKICYECASAISLQQIYSAPGTFSHAAVGFLVGVIFGVLCAALFGIASLITRQVLMVSFAVVGFLVGVSTRSGSENRQGILVMLAAVLATLLTFGLCLYASIIGINNLKFVSWVEFQDMLAKQQILHYWDWISLGVALVIAFLIPLKPGIRDIE